MNFRPKTHTIFLMRIFVNFLLQPSECTITFQMKPWSISEPLLICFDGNVRIFQWRESDSTVVSDLALRALGDPASTTFVWRYNLRIPGIGKI